MEYILKYTDDNPKLQKRILGILSSIQSLYNK